jgi:hypothetical protein
VIIVAQPQGPGLAPVALFPERVGNIYERSIAPSVPGGRGPLRFEEGVATDTDVPNDFVVGMQQGYVSAPGRPNRNIPVWTKYPEETYAQRAHVGSASWVEAPTFLGEFATGGFQDYGVNQFEMEVRSGGYYRRVNATVTTD